MPCSVYVQPHSRVRLSFPLGAGFGLCVDAERRYFSGLSMMFVTGLYKALASTFKKSMDNVRPQCHADNFECTSADPPHFVGYVPARCPCSAGFSLPCMRFVSCGSLSFWLAT